MTISLYTVGCNKKNDFIVAFPLATANKGGDPTNDCFIQSINCEGGNSTLDAE